MMRKRKFNPQAFRVQASSSGRFVEITPEIALFICDEFEELMSLLAAKQAEIERLRGLLTKTRDRMNACNGWWFDNDEINAEIDAALGEDR